MGEISLVGLAANDPIPGEYIEVNFAQGEITLGTGVYAAILLGNKTSAGIATTNTVIYGPDTPVPLSSEADAISLFGSGSGLHRDFRRFVAINSTTPLYAIAVAEGGGAVQATGTVTIANNATAAGAVRLYVGDEFVEVGYISGDTPTIIGDALEDAVNAMTHWPCTAANVAGVITLTAKNGGTRGNRIRYFARVIPSTGTTTTASPVSSTAFTGGSVTDSLTTALATILARRFYYIVLDQEDQTNIAAALTQVNSQALATTGIRQRVFAGSVDTVSNAITISTALNGARAELVWLAQSDYTPGELAAHNAAVYALEEAPAIPRCNFSWYGDGEKSRTNWRVKAPLSGAAPTRAQILSALNSGLTPIAVSSGGSTYLVKRITTRFLTSSQPDYRIRDPHKVTISDRYADDLQAKARTQLRGKNIGDDPRANEPEPAPNVVTPRNVKAMINRLTVDYGENGLLQQVSTITAETLVQRASSPTTRISAQIPLRPVDILDQVAIQINQVA